MSLTAESRLVLIRVKIKRAKKHLVELEAEASEFRETYSNAIGPKNNPQTGQRTIDINSPVSVPKASFNLLATAGDVVQNLRSALDHLAYQLVLVGGVNPSDINTQIAFPICGSAEIYKTAKIRKIEGMRPEAIERIDALEPYKGGNDALWKLHQLNNIDKHRLLLTLGHDYLLQGVGFDGEYWLIADNPTFTGIFGTEMQNNTQFSVPKTLCETEVSEGEPLLMTLHYLVEVVEALVSSFSPFLE